MQSEIALDKLFGEVEGEQKQFLYHDVSDKNLDIYLCQTDAADINLNTLQNFFGDGLFNPNIQGEYLTNILARNAFKGACNLEKTTKLFSFIYEVINPNYPGKTCGLCSLMEFILLSYKGLDIITDGKFAFNYFIWLLNKNLESGFDINYRDSSYNHFLVYCTLTSFSPSIFSSISSNFEKKIKEIIKCSNNILLSDNDKAQIDMMIRYCTDEKAFTSLLKIKSKLFSENNITADKTIIFPCDEKFKYREDSDKVELEVGLESLDYTNCFENHLHQKYKEYHIQHYE